MALKKDGGFPPMPKPIAAMPNPPRVKPVELRYSLSYRPTTQVPKALVGHSVPVMCNAPRPCYSKHSELRILFTTQQIGPQFTATAPKIICCECGAEWIEVPR